jgi:hypothetical protein
MNAFQTVIMTFLLLTNRTPAQLPSAAELLDKYADTQDKLRSSFISKLEIDNSFRAFDKARPNIKPGRMYRKHFKMELRFDGKRSYKYLKMWGDRPGMNPASEAEAQHSYDLWDGQIRYDYITHPSIANDPGKLTLSYDRISHWQHAQGQALRGYFPGVSERIDTELRQARRLLVESRKDGTDGSQLYLVSGSTGGSEFQIWIDPEHGYNIAKAIVKRSWASWNKPEGRPDRSPKGHATVWLDDVSFKKVDDLWVPVAATYRRDHEYVTGEYEKSQYRIVVTEFVVNPDHEALESFRPSFIQNGAEIKTYVDRNNSSYFAWDPKYLWQSGAEIVADHNGRLVRYEPEKKMFPVVKRIPELRYLNLKSIEGKVKDKSVLLCFCNMTQPASQRCLKVLKEQVPNSDDVVVGIVDCSGGIAARGRSRAGLGRSSFSTGVIDRYADKLLRAWGVERLPHLVLTDKNHIVIAEGFGLDELNTKISETENAK